jgi:glycosyltransferase involved in cell wall biosynthesis
VAVSTKPDGSRKAIILAGTSDVGGVEIRIGRLFTALYARDPNVYLITHRTLVDQLDAVGVPISACSDRVLLLDPGAPAVLTGFVRRKLTYFGWMWKAWRLVRKMRIRSAYLAGTGITVGVPLLLDSRTHTIAAYTLPSLGASGITPINRLALAIELNLASRIQVINRQHDLRRFVLNRKKIALCESSFTDLERFKPADHQEPWIVWVGHLEPWKGPLFFLEGVAAALGKLGPEHAEVHVHMAGDGSMAAEVAEFVRDQELSNRVTLWGHVDDVAALVSKSMIFASTQAQTNYPSQSLLEAMACENGIVVTDVGDTRILNNEGNSILVNSAAELGDALVALVSDPVHREELGKAARRTIAEQHTVEVFIAHLETLWARAKEGDRPSL